MATQRIRHTIKLGKGKTYSTYMSPMEYLFFTLFFTLPFNITFFSVYYAGVAVYYVGKWTINLLVYLFKVLSKLIGRYVAKVKENNALKTEIN